MYRYLAGLSLVATANADCLPPLRSNYDFKGVGPTSTTPFDLKWQYESATDYFMAHYNALKAAAQAKVDSGASTGLSSAMTDVGTEKGIATATVQAAQGLLASCAATPGATCERATSMTYICSAVPTIACDGDTITATYTDPQEYSVTVKGNTWSVKYSNDAVLATGSVGTPASTITPITQQCVSDGLCTDPVSIALAEDILPTSTSNLIVGDTFVLDIDDSKDYFHSHYAALKAAASAEGSLPDAFGMLGLPQESVDSATAIYNNCKDSIDPNCEKTLIHAAACLGDTVDCNDGEKWFYNDGDMYSVDTTEDAWTVRYGDKVLASAPIGQGANTITPIKQTNLSNPVSVSLATPFEPLYLGAYNLGTTVTCEFGTPTATCTDDVLQLSGCYATFSEECDDIPNAVEYINKQCCRCV